MAFYLRLTDDQAIPCPNCGSPILTEKFCPGCGTANPINYIDESIKVSKTKVVHRHARNRVPKRVIFIGAGAALAVIIASFVGSSHALNNMQFRIREVSGFDFGSLSSSVKLEACNPTAFPASFDKFSAVVNYRSAEFARMTVDGGTVMPYQASTFDGELKLSAQQVSGLILELGKAVGGGGTGYDESDIALKMTTDAKVLGVFPSSQTREFTFEEFQQFMSTQRADKYLCE
ncbi:MAG: zinc ribbon domain-containing protein [Nitrososphaera sp.]|nr:zinc ribbon domain-containing protein [Nitrososphaera sp.]